MLRVDAVVEKDRKQLKNKAGASAAGSGVVNVRDGWRSSRGVVLVAVTDSGNQEPR
jgi:hypothetical protein